MQILLIGFKGSGATILRRMFSVHPNITGGYADKYLMNRFDDVKGSKKYIGRKYNTFNSNWFESISFYDEINVVDYCRKWIRVFGDTAKIVHIIRHPYDVALTLSKREHGDHDVLVDALETYKEKMRVIIPKLTNMRHVLNIKYEDLLLSPDDMLPLVYDHCEILPDIDFRAALLSKDSPKFINSLDTSGVFSHKYKAKIIAPVNLAGLINVINSKVDGEIYE